MSLNRALLFSAVVCVSTALCAGLPQQRCSAEQPVSGQQEIEKLIAQLGSDSFEVREAATRRLMECDDAITAIRRACQSPDAEMARRAREILTVLSRRAKKAAARSNRTGKQDFARLSDLAKHGAVDQVVELLVQREEWEDESACWQMVAELAQKLAGLGQKAHDKVSLADQLSGETSDFEWAVRMLHLDPKNLPRPRPLLWHGRLVLRGTTTLQKGIAMASHFALTGKVRAGRLSNSVMFTGESVTITDHIINSLIVCDGDIDTVHIDNSIIIARGAIHCKGAARNSLLISGSEVQFDRPKSVIDTKVIEKEPKPLGFVHFFDPADVGIKVESAKGGVRVKEADKGKRFAAAGIQADDVIVAIEGDAATDAETFRRLLRMNLAIGGDFLLKVRRGEKTLEVRVPEKG